MKVRQLAILIGPMLLAVSSAAPGQQASAIQWSAINRQPVAWYRTPEARAIADSVVKFQTSSGGWPKNADMTRPPDAAFLASTAMDVRDPTIDNGATYTQLRFLARVYTASPVHDERSPYVRSFLSGFDYLLAAQYANGGWPQYFPLHNGYYAHITFNDDAMIGVLSLLEDIVSGQALSFVDDAHRVRAAKAVETATAVILRAQIRVNGQLTAWCAQHDAVTLEPRPARSYEHASLSGQESVGIVRFLMRRPPRPDIIEAVEAAVGWLRRVRIGTGDWARFYEIGTNLPIYSGRDGVVRYDIAEIEAERRNGYAWTGTWPARLLDTEYPRWRERLSASRAR